MAHGMDRTPEAAEVSSDASGQLTRLRERLRGASGPRYWRSLDELSQSPEFQELVEREFPTALPIDDSPTSRRRFLQLMGASMALAGLSSCGRQPLEKIVPYVRQPEEIIPGVPLYFASSMPQPGNGLAMGVLVESHMGRPTKIEGNPEHPASLGSTDVHAQSSMLDLYDPHRSQIAMRYGIPRSWDAFCRDAGEVLEAHRALQGAGVAIVTPSLVAPTERRLMDELRSALPKARFVEWETAGRETLRRATDEAFGRALDPVYRFEQAEVVLALDSDFLTEGPNAVRASREFMAKRRVREGHAEMNRLYSVESTPTNTGTVADHRWALSPRELERFALAVAAQMGVSGARAKAPFDSGDWPHRVEAVARDLSRHRGRSLVVAGEQAPVALQVLAHAMNESLGNLGQTVSYLALSDGSGDPDSQLRELVAEIDSGAIEICLLLGVNPVFDAPGDVDLGSALKKVPHCVHLGLHANETAQYSTWHIPQTHWLECFGDAIAADGTLSLAQPLLEPLYDGKSLSQFMQYLIDGDPEARDEDLVQATWREHWGDGGFERRWRKSLHDGLIEDSSPGTFAPSLRSGAASRAASLLGGGEGLSVIFRADPTIFDGRFANNGWLQECPKPLTRLTWDNAALLAPALAEAEGLSNGDVIELSAEGRSIEIPVWIVPGHAPDCITLNFGYGRTHGGPIAVGPGTNVHPLRSSLSPLRQDGVALRRTGAKVELATTQEHSSMEGRDLVREGSLEEYHHDPAHLIDGPESHMDVSKSLYPEWDYSEGYKWGMAIDLTACTGCNACVISCVSENNIAVVGKDQVLNGREMHWIRIDRYFEGDLDHAKALHQPVMCMQCEQAPCEPVCPVGATVHSDEGLNDMIYNRCVGTRYCSNNCPYKVRRFNFLSYVDNKSETRKMQRNPDVTVRMRGVMEKCTYCVQRINHARIEAKKEDRRIRDGEITTACQQVCPSQAIAFGDLNDENSQVSRWKKEPVDYGILTELGTRPRTTYLAKLRNPNPELETGHHG